MPESTHPVDALLDATLDALDPSADERDLALERRLVEEQAERRRGRSRSVGGRRARRARRPVAVTVLAGAAAIILAVAFGPGGDSSSTRSHLPSPDSAEAALHRAGDAAADADWRPLGDDGYFHVATVSFAPDVPGLDPQERQMFLHGVFGSESWMGRDGSGMQLSIDGGTGDPDVYPSIHRDPKTGEVAGVGGRQPKPGEGVNVAGAVTHPNTVNVMAWPRGDEEPYQRGWVRTRSGYLKSHDFVMDERTMGRAQTPTNTVAQFWGTTMAAIDGANERVDPDEAARELIDRFLENPKRPRGATGTTNGEPPIEVAEEVRDREAGIGHAVQLLGSAPLSPEVREALFRWLADQPGAKVRENVADGLDRRGTEVTFESEIVERIPTYTTTAREVLAAYGPPGRPQQADIDPDTVYTVRGNVHRRTWRVSFIMDVERGELLQQYSIVLERRTGARPVYTTWASGPRIDMRDPKAGSGGGGASLYIAREQVTDIKPGFAVCTKEPKVCR